MLSVMASISFAVLLQTCGGVASMSVGVESIMRRESLFMENAGESVSSKAKADDEADTNFPQWSEEGFRQNFEVADVSLDASKVGSERQLAMKAAAAMKENQETESEEKARLAREEVQRRTNEERRRREAELEFKDNLEEKVDEDEDTSSKHINWAQAGVLRPQPVQGWRKPKTGESIHHRNTVHYAMPSGGSPSSAPASSHSAHRSSPTSSWTLPSAALDPVDSSSEQNSDSPVTAMLRQASAADVGASEENAITPFASAVTES
mmetsp:Transcript_104781/g.165426  ORF Transcript_104781/g.165426 Transcript_104781/m.165426 type:complete len:265 (+) Transcript_104781:75-869(+)